ncbi:YwmB family TATA-box binding protein [Ferviditalea candida]|uniref:YwmB family TATA-box binding protein n=1 Tax=Ferviditalea candida TaxID=3108399 RepID=A0ABU5ZKF9_9BACL|nr:YwmB family TATA-box binding protein [Paenibacillaceae bacterium T2]
MLWLRKNKGMAILVLFIIMILCGWNSYSSTAEQASDAQKLWSFSRQELDGPVGVVMQAGTVFKSFTDSSEFLELGKRTSDLLGLPSGTVQLQEGTHLRYEAVLRSQDGITATLIILGMKEGGPTYLFVKVQGREVSSLDPLETLRDRLTAGLRALDLHPQWNTTIQGVLKAKDGGEAAVRKLWNRLGQKLQASKVESYEDARTSSISYYTPQMKESVRTGSRPMNLQAAVHRVTETNNLRVTLGVPVIVTEY